MSRILLIHGPNLALLGKREPAVYGHRTLEQIDQRIRAEAESLGLQITILQSNHEGVILDTLQEARDRYDGIVINPGALAHTSLALADALRACAIPAVEVHLTNVLARDVRRRELVVAEACRGFIAGLGEEGYLLALRFFQG